HQITAAAPNPARGRRHFLTPISFARYQDAVFQNDQVLPIASIASAANGNLLRGLELLKLALGAAREFASDHAVAGRVEIDRQAPEAVLIDLENLARNFHDLALVLGVGTEGVGLVVLVQLLGRNGDGGAFSQFLLGLGLLLPVGPRLLLHLLHPGLV